MKNFLKNIVQKYTHTHTHIPLHAVLWGLSIVLSFVILLPNTPWLCARKCYGDIKMSPQPRWSHTLTQLWGHPCPHNSATARAHPTPVITLPPDTFGVVGEVMNTNYTYIHKSQLHFDDSVNQLIYIMKHWHSKKLKTTWQSQPKA